MREFNWIETYFSPLTNSAHAALGLSNDSALLQPPPGKAMVVSTDAIHESVHFMPGTKPELIAQKALRVNLSDLAASGAKPWCYTMALALPKDTDEAWIADFTKGLQQDQINYDLFLVGGDTTTGPLSVTITIFGLLRAEKMIKRSGAHKHDGLYLTGRIGDGYAGLQHAKAGDDEKLQQHYLLPEPRVRLGVDLKSVATSALDVSDGLVQDAEHLCKASGLGADIKLSAIPVVDSHDPQTLITAGDDYELLFTAPDSMENTIKQLALEHNVSITRIGEMNKSGTLNILDDNDTPIQMERKGYQHL